MFSSDFLHLNLPTHGLYSIGLGNGAEGKTYLAMLFKEFVEVHRDAKLLALTYNSQVDSEFYIAKLCNTEAEYVLLDRFDLYSDAVLVQSLLDLSKHSYVLVDSKNPNFWNKYKHSNCKIRFNSECIYVGT